MDAKMKSAMDKLKSAMSEVESCMSMGSEEPEMEDSEEANVENEGHSEVMPVKADDESSDKKKMVMSMMKKKGY
jgi:hypothetical protein